MQLEPLEQHVLARGLEDHADASTYYVRAVVRNAKTDALIATYDLTDNGNRRFTKTWQVPGDPTGQGTWILVTYTVYTDSGYTTKAENYGERFEEHLILARNSFSGGGGADVDYNRVRKIVAEELTKLVFPKSNEVDFSPLSDSLQAILSEVRAIKIPEAEKVSFTPLMAKFDTLEASLKKAIQDKEVTKETDIKPVLDAIAALQEAIEPYTEQTGKQAEEMLERMKQFFSQDVETIKKQLAKLNGVINRMPFLMLGTPQVKNTEQEDEEIDFSQLLK